MRKRITIIFIVALIVGGIFTLVHFRKKNNDIKERAKTKTAIVKRGDLVAKVTVVGEIQPETIVKVQSAIAGEIKKLSVAESQWVKKGQLLAVVKQEASEARNIASSVTSVKRAKLDLDQAERDLNRQKELYEKGFISKMDVEKMENSYQNKKLSYELALQSLKLNLESMGRSANDLAELLSEESNVGGGEVEDIMICAPISGVVTELGVEVGEKIMSGTRGFGGGTTLMTIADPNKMQALADINEVDIAKIKIGQLVEITLDAIRGKVYHGRVWRISPAGKSQQNIVTYQVVIEITDSDKDLKPGMSADLDIITDEVQDALYVPLEAVIEKGPQKMVTRMEQGKPLPQPVTTGAQNDSFVEITSGLNEGDKVILGSLLTEEMLRKMEERRTIHRMQRMGRPRRR